MASVLLPTASRYGLASLAAELGVPVAASHRALDDAQTSRQVFLHLYEIARQLPPPVLEEDHPPGRGGRMGSGAGLRRGLPRDHARRARSLRQARQPIRYPFLPPTAAPVRCTPPRTPRRSTPRNSASILEPGGPLARRFGAYEHRPQQVTMLRAVARSFSEGRHLMVEAGTGTGK